MSKINISDAELALAEKARRFLPAGGFGNLDSHTIIREGRAGRVWDISGNEYVDFLMGSGPMLVGHAHPEVIAAVLNQIPVGATFFANNEHAILLAEEIVDAVPCAEKVRYVSSGSEADQFAMRVARAYRKRDKILRFEGGYHGMSEYGLVGLWPKTPSNFPRARIDSAGVPHSVSDEVLVAPFNDLNMAQDLIREYRDELGGVIVEPMQRLIPPLPGFLEGLRSITSEYGIPLIFDEVVTGFRLAYGGAQAYYGVVPDLCTLGKAIGGGFPLAAIVGREEIMAHFDRDAVGEDGFVPQLGTLSGNPVAAVAGLATLGILRRPGAYEHLFATGRVLMNSLERTLRAAGMQAQIVGEPPLFDAIFTEAEIQNYRDTLNADTGLYKRFTTLLRQHGIFKGDTKFYVSLAHDEADIGLTLDAFAAVANELAVGLDT